MPASKLQLKDVQVKILVVDDERLVLTALARLLREKYEVYTAQDGDEALKVYEEHHPQIILTDQVMPGKNGLELCEEIKKRDSNTIRIIMTAHKEFDFISKAMDQGLVYYYVYKPINIETMKNVIHRGVLEYVSEVNHQYFIETMTEQNAKLVKQNLQLEEVNKNKAEFLQHLSYRISKPLNEIKEQSELIMQKSELNGDTSANKIFENSLSLSNVVQNLIALGCLETGAFEFKQERFALDELINIVDSGSEIFLGKKNLSLSFEMPENLTHIESDKNVLSLVLKNLINNAIENSNMESVINLEIKILDGNILFTVTNTGKLIPSDVNLFKKVSSFNMDASILESVGLGLAVCSGLVKGISGSIDYVSNENEGTRFTLSIPA